MVFRRHVCAYERTDITPQEQEERLENPGLSTSKASGASGKPVTKILDKSCLKEERKEIQ